MIKNMKMAAKMTLGFGVVIVMVLLVGAVAVFNMIQIQQDTVLLSDEFLQEVRLSTGVDHEALQVMYAARGYAYSGEESFREEARDRLTELRALLEESRVLAAESTSLVELESNVETATATVEQYTTAFDQTVALTEEIAQLRDDMRSASDDFLQSSSTFLENVNASLTNEVQAGAGAEAILLRSDQISLINEVVDNGNEIRVANFESQATGDYSIVREAVQRFEAIDSLISELRGVIDSGTNLDLLTEVGEAAGAYDEAVSGYLDASDDLSELNERRENLGMEVLDAAQASASAGIQNAQDVSSANEERVNAAVTAVTAG
ncbi:MAG: MCP four helix bundle domain-containing protein, partial [Alkalispirochaetaceae bacterium]